MDETYDDKHLKDVLTATRRIAMVGVSLNPVRPSYFVARYLNYRGFEVIPVNPLHVGEPAFGGTVVGALSDITAPVDMVDVFRRSEHVPAVLDEALARFPNLPTFWMQIGVFHAEAAAQARKAGTTVIMNRCPKMEYQRLFGELRKAGINTGIISSRLEL